MRPLAVLIPTRTDAFLQRLLWSVVAYSDQLVGDHRLIIADNGLSTGATRRIQSWAIRMVCVQVPEPFVFARAVNLAAAAAPPDADLLVCNDDLEFASMRPLTTFRELLAREREHGPTVGLLSAAIRGGVGNPDQRGEGLKAGEVGLTPYTLAFVCVAIRRETWDAVGPLDEAFVESSFDDADYCVRAGQAGYGLGVTADVVVRHHGGDHPEAMSGTLRQRCTPEERTARFEAGRRRFEAKWQKSHEARTRI